MSGGPHQHPHGRQGQPNPGWNPLQLSNYFPGRPQVAHMSSDRPMSHSPLTWHTPTPPDHQKGAPNPYRHTPTPPDVQALKAASTLPYRHTPTPPDLKSFRHTPTPPDVAHSMKTSGVLHYRHTPPPPDIHKGAPSPLFNLQQMISDARGTPRENIRDNMGFTRHSPGLTHGSMDLSVTRSPRNGGQNGETTAPISLSVRDATKINSLDSAEISKIHQPLMYSGKPLDMKPSSPTINSMNQRSNSPKSPLSNSKRPVKKVDSILERLNSVSDGVVITPVQHTPSPQSVIVSAHSLEDSNSRGSSSSVNITHMAGITPYFMCEAANMERVTPPTHHPHNPIHPLPHDEPTTASLLHPPTSLEITSKTKLDTNPIPPVPHSVIKESNTTHKESAVPPNCTNEDSNSSSDSGRQRRKRKQSKTVHEDNIAIVNEVIENCDDSLTTQQIENHSPEMAPQIDAIVHRLSEQLPLEVASPMTNFSDMTANGIPVLELSEGKKDSVPVVSKTRRKTSSESETIDNIAAMIASTENTGNITSSGEPADSTNFSNPASSVMQTEQLQAVLGSPEPEYEKESTNQTTETLQPDTTPNTKLEKRKRTSRSQSTELSQSDNKPPTESTNNGNPKSNFVEVENELEKMFAGIENNDTSTLVQSLDPVTGLITNNVTSECSNTAEKKTTLNKRAVRRPSSASQPQQSNDGNRPKKKEKISKKNKSLDSSGGKKRKSKANVSISNKKIKRDKSSEKSKLELLTHKDAYDSGSNASSSKSRGPYVQIKGPRDSPLSVSVINTPIQEEDGEKPLQKVKTFKPKSSLNSDSDFKNKVKSKGLHSSTLSMKYDATNIDTSWICVFCKKGPHTGGICGPRRGNAKQMGDLFGPYIISSTCTDFNSMICDPQDSLFKNKVKPGTFSQNRQAKPPGRKSKAEIEAIQAKPPKDEIFFGMTEASSNSYEVWFHEDCALWAPGLYLVGAKTAGLDNAVWGSCTVKCDHCKMSGANLACIQRGCNKSMHVNCARTELWSLNEDTFRVLCREHATP